MSDVFVSYARSTATQAQAVAEALRALGYSVWIDDDLPAHRAYGRVLEEQMMAARAAVVLWSADAVQSEWVLSEANRAREGQKLVQVSIDQTRLPMPFDTIQCADLSAWNGDLQAPGWRKVVASIDDLIGGTDAAAPSTTQAALPLPSKPSIAVLPFANLSGDPEQEYFADGMVEEITRALSRSQAIFVTGASSGLSFKGKATPPKEATRALGVRYALVGSVRKAGARVRIAVELIDGADGEQIWADRFEDTLEDVFALQDRVALSVAGVIEPAMREADMRRLAGRPTENLGSYDLYLRAFSIYASLSRADMRAALALLDRAIVLDPGYGAALALAAFCHVFLVASGWSDHPEAQLASARALIARALTSGRDDPEVLGGLAIAIGLLGEDREVPVSLADRAVEINPGSSQAWMASGFARTNMGEPALGFEHLETALRLDPLSQFRPNILAMQGYARFAQGRFREAVSLLKQSVRMQPEFLMAYVFLAAGHGHLGDKAAAREAIGSFQTVSDVDFHAFAAGYPDPKARSLVVEGIALAAADV